MLESVKVQLSNLLGIEKIILSINEKQNLIDLITFENSFDPRTMQNVFQSIKNKFAIKN
jgi:hypothetical protein